MRKYGKMIAYILTVSILTGTCLVPTKSVYAAEAQNEIVEVDDQETVIETDVNDKDSLNTDGSDDLNNEQAQSKGEQDQSKEEQDQSKEERNENIDNDVDEGQNQNQEDAHHEDTDAALHHEEEGSEQGQENASDDQDVFDDQNKDENDNDGQNGPVEEEGQEEAKIDISSAEVFLDKDSYVLDGNVPHPEVTVSFEGITLIKDSEYEVHYDESSDVGTHVVAINGIGDYTGSTQIEYRIEKKEQIVSGTSAYTKKLGDSTFQLDAKTDGEGTLVYGSSNNKVATVTSSGRVTIKGIGTTIISVYARETEDSKKSSVLKITIKVLKKAQNVTVTAVYKKALGQQAFKLNASTDGDGVLKYSINNSKVATVDKNGKVTIKGIGIAKIKIYATETTTFAKSAVKTVTIKVSPKKMAVSSVANTANNKLTVKWKKQSGITGYQIQYSTKTDFSKAKTVSTNAAAVSKVLSGLTKNATYHIRIRSYKTVGSEKLYSAWSASKSIKINKGVVKTYAKTPTISVKAHDTEFKNTISWKKLTGASGYDVYYKKGANGSWKKAGTTTALSYIHKVGHGVRYYYKVRAYQELADGSRIYGKFSKDRNMLQSYKPQFSVFMSPSTNMSTTAVAMSITNNGIATLRVYSNGACMSDHDYSKYDRLLYLTKSRDGHADLAEAKYMAIKPGTSAIIGFEVIGDATWYDEKTTVYFKFRYDGMDYVASASSYYGTAYDEQ